MQNSVAPKEDGRLVRGEQTRERVLDAAERLFADHGFDAVSIRQIAAEAEVTLGVVGFHSGSKEQLFTTILKRRVDTLSEKRLERLQTLRRDHEISIYGLMSAYIEPYLELASTGGQQWRAYAKLIANVAGDSRWYPYVRDLYDPLARAYIEEILRLYPSADRKRVGAAFVLAVAAMLSTLVSTLRMASLGDPNSIADDVNPFGLDIRKTVVEFCTAGIESAVVPTPDSD